MSVSAPDLVPEAAVQTAVPLQEAQFLQQAEDELLNPRGGRQGRRSSLTRFDHTTFLTSAIL